MWNSRGYERSAHRGVGPSKERELELGLAPNLHTYEPQYHGEIIYLIECPGDLPVPLHGLVAVSMLKGGLSESVEAVW